jgi:hypothetical protein
VGQGDQTSDQLVVVAAAEAIDEAFVDLDDIDRELV